MALDQEDEILDEGEEEEVNWTAVIIAAVVVLALIAGAVWFFFIREVPEGDAKVELPKWVPPPEGFAEETVNDFLPVMVINPSDSKGRYFLVVKLDFALNDVSLVANWVYGKPWRLAQVKNIIVDVFNSYAVDELKMPKYKEEARQKIWETLNGLVGWVPSTQPVEEGYEDPNPPPIKAIYFSQYILQ
jgi:flagellar basal body-associated protein FliL